MRRRFRPRFSRRLALLGMPLLAGGLVGASSLHQEAKVCRAVHIELKNAESNPFLTQGDVRHLINTDNHLLGTPLNEIHLTAVEKRLRETEYVRGVQAHFNPKGELNLNAELRVPIARFLDNSRQSFYLDSDLNVMPLNHKRSVQVLLVRGNVLATQPRAFVPHPEPRPELLRIVEAIHRDTLLKSWLAEAYVEPNGFITFYPEFGQMPIEFGTAHGYAAKLRKLRAFFTQVIRQTGWDRYTRLRLQFENQVVAVRKTDPNA